MKFPFTLPFSSCLSCFFFCRVLLLCSFLTVSTTVHPPLSPLRHRLIFFFFFFRPHHHSPGASSAIVRTHHACKVPNSAAHTSWLFCHTCVRGHWRNYD